ncbi:MAG: hypothetical protein M1826_000929 [Phylliscum demangeonii]|nr:MAG: hypothetical protein M1826_000929 [Phylliscum demangeonii]
MATKTVMASLPMHTAGIYSDMTVDGPEIGDLVVIVDKAKNLPNRKTMGKQDPYCAARLGKEAKKTETDKRGGQTPRWDQELRFLVHDSPDYQQLKVSVFNDDKRTDLIGETWVNLEAVVVRGGGKSDAWHILNCKGRYAGDIRLEITYYDSRPKDEPLAGRRRESGRTGPELASRESLSGPRPPKSIARRPLPVDPVTGSPPPTADAMQPARLRPSPPGGHEPVAHYLAHTSVLHRGYSAPVQDTAYTRPEIPPQASYGPPISEATMSYVDGVPGPVMPPPTHEELRAFQYPDRDPSLRDHDPPGPNYDQPLRAHSIAAPIPERPVPAWGSGRHQPPRDDDDLYEPSGIIPPSRSNSMPTQAGYTSGGHPASSPVGSDARQRPTDASVLISTSPGSAAYGQLAPAARYGQPSVEEERPAPRRALYQHPREEYSPHPPMASPYHHTPPPSHRYSHGPGYETVSAPMHSTAEEIPPPPPAHRSTPSQVNVTHRPGTGSPLAQSPSYLDPEPLPARDVRPPRHYSHPMPPYPTSDYDVPRSSPLGPTQPFYEQQAPYPQRHSPGAFPTEFHQAMTPSLVPGYDTRTGDVNVSGRREAGRQGEGHPAAGYSPSTAPPRHHRHYGSDTALQTTSSVRFSDAEPPRSSAGSLSAAPSIAATVDRRRVPRKSVSPRPSPGAEVDPVPAVPFSPDDYNVLNPKVSSAAAQRAGMGARYRTPEEAEDVARQHQLDARRPPSDGPIIGYDGRVIDPSDHLPADTWAPEPERKGPARTSPQPDSRTRPSPHGAQPMPPAARRAPRDSLSRPSSLSGPVYPQHSDPSTPSSATRTRLQKRAPPAHSAPAPHLYSSPLAPHGSFHSTPRSALRTTPSRSPLPEHEPYAAADRSPPASPYDGDYDYDYDYGRHAASTAPPPIPAKVPLRSGRDDFAALSLSEELSTIDIGGGRRRIARQSYHH